MLTKEQKAAYLADPNTCPYCGNPDLMTYTLNWCTNDAYRQQAICQDSGDEQYCGRSWYAVYTLTAIEEVES